MRLLCFIRSLYVDYLRFVYASCSTNAACDRDICWDIGRGVTSIILTQGARRYISTAAAMIDIAHSVHCAALMETATSGTGRVSRQRDRSDVDTL